MDYQQVASIAKEHAAQTLHSMNLESKIHSEIASQVEFIINSKIEEQFSDMRINIDILNKQIKLLKDIVEQINDKIHK